MALIEASRCIRGFRNDSPFGPGHFPKSVIVSCFGCVEMSQRRVSEIFELPTVSTKPLPLFTDALTMVTIDSLNSGNMMLAFSLPGRLLFWL